MNNYITCIVPYSSVVSIATDIMADRLHKAKLMGADVIVDGKTENLKEAGLYIVHRTKHWFINQQPHLKGRKSNYRYTLLVCYN